jgi:hypothetical protein
MRNNWLSNRIRFISNRIRCSNCYRDSSEMIFIIGEGIRFKIPIDIKEDYSVNFNNKNRKMRINKFYELESVNVLTMICTRCGKSRKTTIPDRLGVQKQV